MAWEGRTFNLCLTGCMKLSSFDISHCFYSLKCKRVPLTEYSITLPSLSFYHPRSFSEYYVIQRVSKLNSYFSLKELEKI